LAAAERAEVTVLQAYMPQPYSAEEIERLVSAAIEQVSAAGPKDIGAVMAVLRPQLAGRADMGAVSQQVKTRLGGSR
jgi:uncharacterized protein YqeY